MLKFIRLITALPALAIFCSSCHSPSREKSSTVLADSVFQKLADNYISRYLELYPGNASYFGFHEYDGRLPDLRRQAFEDRYKYLQATVDTLQHMDTAAMSARNFYDYQVLRNQLNGEMLWLELKSYRFNPMSYFAFDPNAYMKRDYAPLAERVRSLIKTEEGVPAFFRAARENLADSIPAPFISTAIEIGQGSVGFMLGDLITAVKEVKNDSLLNAFIKVNRMATDSMNSYMAWLKKEKMPKSNAAYAIGRDAYMKMLHSEQIDLTPEQVLELGLKELKKEQEAFNAAAHIIDPKKKPVDVYHDLQKEHPAADSLIPEAKKNLEAIRSYLIAHDIISIPSEVRVKVKETPAYARSTSTASMDSPGPFEKKATESYYYITPVEKNWTAAQKEDWLHQFDYYTTDNVTIHEAYPGHYVQGLHLNASDATKLEKLFGSYCFVEGWAHYCEIMMVEQHYGGNGDSVRAAKYKLAQSGDALLRLCRLCVSVKIHCQGMTLDQGTKFFMDNWYQGEKPSHQEALRGTFDAGYCFYTLGKLQLLKLREDYQRQEGASYSLKKFNDAVLDNGQPAIRLLRVKMLKDSSSWSKVL